MDDGRTWILGATGFLGRALHARLPRAQAPDRRALDLRDPVAVERWVREERPGLVFNLAAVGVRPGPVDEQELRWVNGQLPRLLLRALGRHARDALLVQAGSIAEEEDSPYGRSKADALASMREQPGARRLHARIFQVYGPGEPEGRLLPSLRAWARGPRTPPLALGPAEARRDWIHLDDVVGNLLRLAAQGREGEVELGTGRLRSVGEVVKLARAALGLPASAVAFGLLPGRPLPERAARDPLPHPPRGLEAGLAELGSWP